MGDEKMADNPFAALFATVDQAQQCSSTLKSAHSSTSHATAPMGASGLAGSHTLEDISALVLDKVETSAFIEHVFLITLDREPSFERVSQCILLEELHTIDSQTWLDLHCLEQAVFERLMMSSPADHMIVTSAKSTNEDTASEVSEGDALLYLYQSFCRLQKQTYYKPELTAACRNAIVMNAKTCLQVPLFFPQLDTPRQFLHIFSQSSDWTLAMDFFESVTLAMDADREEGSVLEGWRPILDAMTAAVRTESSLSSATLFHYADVIMLFTRQAVLAEAFIAHSQPDVGESGRAYEQTLLGGLLAVSCVVTSDNGPFEFFDRPSRYSKQEHDLTERNIHQPVGLLNDKVYCILNALLRLSPSSRHALLQWLGNCMRANKDRAKMWSSQLPTTMVQQLHCSDGFLLNLCAVLLRLCQPFTRDACSPRLLLLQPSYCIATAAEEADRRARNVHMIDLTETSLIPAASDDDSAAPPMEETYNFVTECFFLTHYALHLGFHVIHERFVKLNQHLHRIQGVYQDIVRQGGEGTEPGQRIKEQMEKGMTKFLCLKAALSEPRLLDLCFDLHVATTTYLNQLATTADRSRFVPVQFPLPTAAPPELAAIPEFIVENLLDFLMFLRRFKDSLYQVAGEKLEHLMTFVLVFMGSPRCVNNPHLRAMMAEALDAMKPPDDTTSQTSTVTSYNRTRLFAEHPLVGNVAETLLRVFVSIEMTGQGVEFEQKFNYRRPMYAVLQYISGIDLHRKALKSLSEFAEQHIEDTDAPLFLRFINLLMNDAIFLLDEALSYMTQIKQKQAERDTWSSLASAPRQEAEMNYHHLSMLARFHNLMSNDTIHCLQTLTGHITAIFTQAVIVDRIASMLNYFLLNLVGPKKKNLKVKDFGEFEFRPQELVSDICHLYVNMSSSAAFCGAVARDGRSYSPALFTQATAVLVKISAPEAFVSRFTDVAAKIQTLSTEHDAEEEALADAPDEFLDPIMGSLMMDPVLLPSSKQVVDRTTIARHILSDQSDPFNRQPLTMDMVQSVADLREKIRQWLEGRQRARHIH